MHNSHPVANALAQCLALLLNSFQLVKFRFHFCHYSALLLSHTHSLTPLFYAFPFPSLASIVRRPCCVGVNSTCIIASQGVYIHMCGYHL